MVASPIGCGVEDHAESCLCDVVITKPTTFAMGFSDLKFYDYISAKVGFASPFTGESLADFMTKYLDVFAEIDRLQKLESKARAGLLQPITEEHPFHRVNNRNTKLSEEQFEWLKEQIVSGGGPTATARLMMELHGIKINKSYVNKLRMRMKESGEYDYRISQRRDSGLGSSVVAE